MNKWLRANAASAFLIVISVFLFAVAAGIRQKQTGPDPNHVWDDFTPEEDDSGLGLADTAAVDATYNVGGYASKVSVVPGESIDFHISGGGSNRVDLSIFREGPSRQLKTTLSNITVGTYNCDGKYATGCNWPVATSFTVPSNWQSGVYIVTIKPVGSTATRNIIFWLRPSNPGANADILFLSSVNTHQAYNKFGGGSHYAAGGVRSDKISFNRPYDASNGLGKYARWEGVFVPWLESNGYVADYATTYDLYYYPDLLNNYKLVILTGHSEYWTREARQRLKNFVNNGGRVMMLSGNNMWWQIRYEDNGRTMVTYKKGGDPIKTQTEGTTNPDRPPIFDNPMTITGFFWPSGGYPPSSGNGTYVVNSKHWIYNGTNVSENQFFGKGSTKNTSLHDHETDGMSFNCDVDGRTLLGPLANMGTPANFTILGITNTKTGQGRYTFGLMGIYTTPKGGALFNGATTGWAKGLKDPVVTRITRNIIDRFVAGNIPAEPLKPDTDYYFYDRFNCYDIGKNRFGGTDWKKDVGYNNFLKPERAGVVALTTECGVQGSGLSLKPPSSTAIVRIPVNILPNWQSTDSLYSRFSLNLASTGLTDGAQFTLWEQSYHNRVNPVVPVAQFQVRRQNGTTQVRYQPAGANYSWVNVPTNRFFLVETGWDKNGGKVSLHVDGSGYIQSANLSGTEAINRFDLGSMNVTKGFSGNYCLDELIMDGRPIGYGPNPTPVPSTTPGQTNTPEPTVSPTSTPEDSGPGEPTETPTPTATPNEGGPGEPTPPTPTNTPEPISCNIAPNTLVRNPGFDGGTTDWKFYSDVSGNRFAVTSESSWGCGNFGQVTINNKGSNVQLHQTNLAIEQGKTYALRFSARADTNRSIKVFMHLNKTPNTNLGLSQTVYLTNSWQTYDYTFTATGTTTDARLRLWFSNQPAGSQMVFDNFSLTTAP
jgi:hypothetical protein